MGCPFRMTLLDFGEMESSPKTHRPAKAPAACAPQHGSDAGHQLLGAEGLWHIVVHPKLKAEKPYRIPRCGR